MFAWLKDMFSGKIGQVSYHANSAIGFVRQNNEDNWFVNDERTLFVVADGMGGGEQGEVASKVLVDMMKKVPASGDFDVRSAAVLGAFKAADTEIKGIAEKNAFKHMGTTGIVLLIDSENKSCAKVFHVGDSRCYHVKRKNIVQLTRDHTIGGELSGYTSGASSEALANRENPLAHVLTRAIGVSDNSEAEIKEFTLKVGSRLILCTDGVHDVISNKSLNRLLTKKASLPEIGKELDLEIVKAGAPDNFTYIILEAEEGK